MFLFGAVTYVGRLSNLTMLWIILVCAPDLPTGVGSEYALTKMSTGPKGEFFEKDKFLFMGHSKLKRNVYYTFI